MVASFDDSPFALLDDRDATPQRPTSRLYTGFLRAHHCTDAATLDAMWAQVDADVRAGLHAVVLADYEWGAKLLRAGHLGLPGDDTSALRVLVFAELARLSRDAVDAWLAQCEGTAEPGAAGVTRLRSSVDAAQFERAIARIHTAIQAGETYQVNYTLRLHAQAYGAPVALYRRLRALQPVAFGAFIQLPPSSLRDATTHVLSCSPELCLRHDDGVLTARPMKGTAPRVGMPTADVEAARALAHDPKNRAENLMIVDLLRNDIGRIAQTGSVSVPTMFAVEPYATVLQMTSTVQARLRPEVTFPELLRAVFPCGSITGAPKHHTMELIAGLESTPRGLYCGAIGWIDEPAADRPTPRIGNFCLSVAIRTITLGPEAGRDTPGLRAATLGIGAGIVLDSVAADEWAECWLKSHFLSRAAPGFELFETMLATAAVGVAHFDRHLARLADSARALGFAFDRDAAQALIAATLAGLSAAPAARYRLKLTLAHDGRLRLAQAVLPALPHAAGDAAVHLLIAEQRLPNQQPLSAFKTTLRQAYDDGVRAAEAAGAFDSLFFTADGRLVEGGRTSVFVKLDGVWCTPPVADGALPGVMRALVLEGAAWHAVERSLWRADLDRADAVMVCNALRGPLTARVIAGGAVHGGPRS